MVFLKCTTGCYFIFLKAEYQSNTKLLLTLNKDKITEIFVVVDDFRKEFHTEIKVIKLNLLFIYQKKH